MGSVLQSLKSAYWPRRMTGTWRDHARASLGAGLGILITGWLAHWALHGNWQGTVTLIAPMGASAVILFCLPSSPLAQPWAMLAGNTLAASIGVLCAQGLPQHLVWAAALAMLCSIALMFALRCLHPPSGAVALTAVLGGPAIHQLGFQFVWWPVLANSVCLMVSATLFHRLTGFRYPVSHQAPATPAPAHLQYQFGFQREDLQAALGEMHEVLDIETEQLQALLQHTELIAYQRKLEAITCQQIMRPAPLTFAFGEPLETAWQHLQTAAEPAVPVVNPARLVLGLLSVTDFLRHAEAHSYRAVTPALQRLIHWTRGTHSQKPEVVGQIMQTPVVTIEESMHLIHTIPLMTSHHLHCLPVVNARGQLVGVLTQTDIIQALYR